jgi:hypothetical protein
LREKRLFHLILKMLTFYGKTPNALSTNSNKINRLYSLEYFGLSFRLTKDIIMKILFKKERKDKDGKT